MPAAEALAEQHPLAASVLYRALLDDILARAKSPAYGHGAKYLGHLDRLAQEVTGWQSLPDHVRYREQIKKQAGLLEPRQMSAGGGPVWRHLRSFSLSSGSYMVAGLCFWVVFADSKKPLKAVIFQGLKHWMRGRASN